ncbi:MAG: OmpA family protein [Candidatus Methylacidiphilales bacterium]
MKNILIILVLFITKFALAQEAKPNNNAKEKSTKNSGNFTSNKFSRFSIAGGIGSTYTIFDIDQDQLNPIYSLGLRYSVGHIVSLRLQGLYGTYSGKNNQGIKKDFGYANNIGQVGFHIIGNLGSLNFRTKKPKLIFYTFTGFTLTFSDGVRDKNISTLGARTYAGVDYSIPVGFGAKYKINDQFDFGLEGVVNLARTDKYDLYDPTPNQGFPDMFGSIMLSIGYNFTSSNRTQHLDWANPMAVIYDDLAKKAKKSTEALKADGDKDGIPDYLDLEPNTKLGYKVDVKGVTLDSDMDGIPDTDDTDPYGFSQMLSVYYPAENFQVKSSIEIMKFSDSIPKSDFITLSTEGYGLPIITFEPNKYDIHVEQYPLLQQIARIMATDSSVNVAIIGHADENKPDMTQFNVAEKRALAVKRKLVKIFEISEDRILVFSERDPFVKKYKMQTEGLDRKVEFRLIRKQ